MTGVTCMLMRGGTSKGAFFLASDLPHDSSDRNDLLLRIMGSPDPRQVDGLGGGHPLTSKVAIVSPAADNSADVDYLFLQVSVEEPVVSDRQSCGNLLAGVGPFALERGLLPSTPGTTEVRIQIMNPGGSLAVARVLTPSGQVDYRGDVLVSGAPFPAAPIELSFPGRGSIFPTGRLNENLAGVAVTCVDAGMPVVLIRARDLGLAGDESPTALEADTELTARIEQIRLLAGPAMGLGDVSVATVPKLSIVSPARAGGLIATRTFIPRRVHTSIGVLGALSVAAGTLTPGTVAAAEGDAAAAAAHVARIEHPTGYLDVEVALSGVGPATCLERGGVLRTARKIFDGTVWPREGAQ